MKKAYRLTPSLHDNLWGGNRLREYGKTSEKDRIAESWELSFVEGEQARIEDGRTLSEAFGREAWGKRCEKFDFFPTLTKFIDAREKLSVQVHPDDAYALANEGQYGKTEMWYVVDADEGAGLYIGLNGEYTAEEFSSAVADGTVEKMLERIPVRAGDVFFIPSRTVHAILDGVLIYEIQQNSTLTYRLYDYMRRDKNGNLRDLHIEKAMKVTDLAVYDREGINVTADGVIGSCEYFESRLCKLNSSKTDIFVDDESFVALTCVRGCGMVDGESFSAGDSFFIPAGAGELTLESDTEADVIIISIP